MRIKFVDRNGKTIGHTEVPIPLPDIICISRRHYIWKTTGITGAGRDAVVYREADLMEILQSEMEFSK